VVEEGHPGVYALSDTPEEYTLVILNLRRKKKWRLYILNL